MMTAPLDYLIQLAKDRKTAGCSTMISDKLTPAVFLELMEELLRLRGGSPGCTCAEIQRSDPRRHFKGCPLRQELAKPEPASPRMRMTCSRCGTVYHTRLDLDGPETPITREGPGCAACDKP